MWIVCLDNVHGCARGFVDRVHGCPRIHGQCPRMSTDSWTMSTDVGGFVGTVPLQPRPTDPLSGGKLQSVTIRVVVHVPPHRTAHGPHLGHDHSTEIPRKNHQLPPPARPGERRGAAGVASLPKRRPFASVVTGGERSRESPRTSRRSSGRPNNGFFMGKGKKHLFFPPFPILNPLKILNPSDPL